MAVHHLFEVRFAQHFELTVVDVATRTLRWSDHQTLLTLQLFDERRIVRENGVGKLLRADDCRGLFLDDLIEQDRRTHRKMNRIIFGIRQNLDDLLNELVLLERLFE